MLRVNDAWRRRLGHAEAELVGQSIFDFILEEDRPASLEAARGLAEGIDVVQFENRYRTRDGGHRWISWSATYLAETHHIYAVGRDIQAQKEAEAGLASSIRELREMRAALDEHAIVSLSDGEGNILFANDRFCTASGYTREEVLGQNHRILNSGYHPKAFFTELWDTLKAGQVWRGVIRNRAKDGSLYWVSSTIVPLRGDEGRPERYLAILLDITETLRLNDRVAEMGELLSQLARQIPGVIYQFRLWSDGRASFPFASEAIREIYEVTPEEVRDDAGVAFDRIHPEDRAQVLASIRASAESLEPWRDEYRVVLPRQGLRWRLGVARPQRLEDGSILWHGFITDITDQRQSEAILRASEEKFRVLFERSSNAHLLFDDTGILDCNPAAVEMLRAQDKAQILRLHPAVLSPEFQPDGERSLDKSVRMDQLARDRGYHRFEWIHRKLDGTPFPVEVTLSPVHLQGKPTLLVVWHDLTEQKQAEEALTSAVSLLTTTLDSTADGIMAVAKDRSLALFNQRFVEIWRIPQAVLALQDDARTIEYALSQLENPGAFLAKMDALAIHAEDSSFDVHRLVDGRVIECYSRPQMEGDRPMGRVWSFRDVTEKAVLDRLKSEFVSTVSHELRTPLTSIRGSVGLVAGGAMGALSPEAQGLLEIACRNADRLTDLINDLLDSEKLEAGSVSMALESVALGPLLEQSLLDNQGYADLHGVRLHLGAVAPGAVVLADRGRLLQVLSNLLSNAAKFSPRGGLVEVAAGEDPLGYSVEVTDHGEGIPPAFYDRIFQKFSQADASDTRRRGGTGLGLSITRTLVERMGGAITFRSELGRGTTFAFTLRRAPGA